MDTMPKFVVKSVEEEEEDVCCVGCGEYVCKFNEEPNHKDDRDEAVCDECVGSPQAVEQSVNCFFCEVEIIRDSEEHDICHITEDGELCCQECLSCCDCELCEKEDTGFGTAYHDGTGYDDCDPQGKGNRLCGNLSDNDSCSECVYLRTEKE